MSRLPEDIGPIDCERCGERYHGEFIEAYLRDVEIAGGEVETVCTGCIRRDGNTTPTEAGTMNDQIRTQRRHTMSDTRLIGHQAIEYAEEHDGCVLHKYADPTEGARVVTYEEALEVAVEDPALIWTDTLTAHYTWLVDSETWGDGWTDSELEAMVEIADTVDDRLYVRMAGDNEGAGYYLGAQILGYSVPVPEELDDMANHVWNTALDAFTLRGVVEWEQ